MYAGKGRQWGLILFFSAMGVCVGSVESMCAAVSPVGEHALNGQSDLVIQTVARFLNAKDCLQFAHTNSRIHSTLTSQIADANKELREKYLLKHTWNLAIEHDKCAEIRNNLEAFRQQLKNDVDAQKERSGVKVDVGCFLQLGQELTGKLLSYLIDLLRSRQCEIVKLDIGSNMLTHVPHEICQMKLLKNLILDGNPLDYSAGMFKDLLPPLKKLGLANTNLSQIPEGIFEGLASIESLNLYSNDLTRVAYKDIRSLAKLRTLNLVQNQLQHLDADLTQHPALVKMDISGNPEEFKRQVITDGGIASFFGGTRFNVSVNRMRIYLERASLG